MRIRCHPALVFHVVGGRDRNPFLAVYVGFLVRGVSSFWKLSLHAHSDVALPAEAVALFLLTPVAGFMASSAADGDVRTATGGSNVLRCRTSC